MGWKTVTLMFVAGKFWEILSYVFVVVMYGLTRRRFHKQVQRISYYDSVLVCVCVSLHDAEDCTIVNLREEVYTNKRTVGMCTLLFYKWAKIYK